MCSSDLEQLLFEGLLREDPNDGRPLVGVGDADAVRAVFRGERRVLTRKPPEGEGRTRKKRGREPATLPPKRQGRINRLKIAWRTARDWRLGWPIAAA